jgi:hypothetical protein
MRAIIYNENGRILRGVDTSEDLLPLQKLPEEFLMISEANPVDHYVDVNTKEIKSIPTRPSEYAVFDWKTKSWIIDNSIAEQIVISKRKQLLFDSDWTDTFSASTRLVNYVEWQAYRQALRDITAQEGYPISVVWPSQPT